MPLKHTNDVQFHIQDWRTQNLVIGRLTKALGVNHFKSFNHGAVRIIYESTYLNLWQVSEELF